MRLHWFWSTNPQKVRLALEELELDLIDHGLEELGETVSDKGDPQILKEGMTFHIIPWVWGVDGDKTVGISDTFYVTENGCESFFSLPEEFTLKGGGGKSSAPAAPKKKSQPAPAAE